jgi:glutathione S-transferase
VRYLRDPSTGLAPPELLAVHPLGKAPVITDGTVTVAESGAIIEYLTGRYDDGRLRPAEDTPERLAYTYWLHYAEGTFMPLMILSLIMRRIASAPMPFFIKPVARGIVAKVRSGYLDPNLARNLAFLESSLARSDWFCGERMTAADIQMSFAVEAAAVRADLHDHCPRLAGFLERIHARPAYRAALEKGGPYQLLG